VKLSLPVSVVSLVLCALVVWSPPAGATSEMRQRVAAPKPPPPDLAVTAGLRDEFAKWLLKTAGSAAASQGFGLIFSAIGLNNLFNPDPNTALLEEIREQLREVSRQIQQVQHSINVLTRDVRQGNLDHSLRLLDEKVTQLRSLFNRKFLTIVSAAEGVARAEDAIPPDRNRIREARDELIRARDDFYDTFDGGPYAGMPEFIHRFLVPGPATSVLAAKGRVLLANHRYLTSAASREIRALYDALAAEEALAAWMLMERDLPTIRPFPPHPTSPGSLEHYNLARRQFLGYRVAEARYLPPMIPANAVIDSGPTAGESTNHRQMWLPVSANLRFQPDVDAPGTVPAALTTFNQRYPDGFNNWQAPSQNAVSALLSGFTSEDRTPNRYLSGINASSAAWQQVDKNTWPFVWSSDVLTQRVTCISRNPEAPNSVTVNVPTHTGVSTSTSTPAWSPRPPVQSGVINDPNPSRACADYVRHLWATAPGGGLLATRSTGSMPMDYMAQGLSPNLRPGANLRHADLDNLALAGVDLTGADLTGATLTGALFSVDEDGGPVRVNLTDVELFGVTSGGIIGHAALPAPWLLVHGYLIGPGAHLFGADLAGTPDGDPPAPPADLTRAVLTGVVSGHLDCTGCKLPAGWRWTGLPSGYLVGPGANLAGADLSRLDLRGVNLTGADLSGALLSGANLSGANLDGTNLSHADLTGTVLTDATLRNVSLSHANAVGANLTDADMTSANLENADFSKSNMTRAVLSQARILATNFGGATLFRVASGPVIFGSPAALPPGWRVFNGLLIGPGANLSGLPLTGLNLTGFDLTGVDFTGANLSNALLTNATLVNVTLTNAVITNATFSTDNDNRLAGIISGGLVGAPGALPSSGRFRVVQGYLVGPNVNLAGATFTSAAQLGVSLSGTNFTGATLAGVNLTGAFLNNAILTGARLTGATLGGANMSNATLDGVISGGIVGTPTIPTGWRLLNRYLVGSGANLSGASLPGAQLAFMNLSAANLRSANLSGAQLGAANLEGADITGANLTGANWAVTTCPDGVRRNTPCAPVVWLGSSTVTASAEPGSRLLIDVVPGLAGRTWRVTVQQLSASGGWFAVTKQTTRGPGDILRLHLPNGTYRAMVPPQHSYHGSVSGAVVLKPGVRSRSGKPGRR
jgi:uncharacterized protein YjbI with pentapeptide repeats